MKTKIWAVLAGVLVMAILCTCASAQVESEKRLTLNFRDVPISNALAILFEGINYVPEPGIQGTVSLSLNDVPFTDALQALLKAGGLTARKESNIYYIGPQKELAAEAPPPQFMAEAEFEVQREKIPEKIPIDFADVADIGAIFGAQSIGTRMGSMMGGGGMMGGMGGSMGGYGGGMMGGMGGSMGGYGGGMMGGMGGSMMGGMGGYGGGMMGGMGGSMGGYGGGMQRW